MTLSEHLFYACLSSLNAQHCFAGHVASVTREVSCGRSLQRVGMFLPVRSTMRSEMYVEKKQPCAGVNV